MRKNLLLLVFFFVIGISTGKCQAVFPAYTENPLWRSMTCLYGIGIYCWTDSLHYDYDTTFCGYTYSKVSINGNAGYCRTNSLKTFVRSSNNCSDSEFLMYDYSMNIGDTTHVGYNLFWSADSAKMMLSNIDTVVYFGVSRRRFHMLFDHNQPHSSFLYVPMTWIEGIGSDWNPFYPLYCLHDGCESTYSLRCFDSSSVQLYINPSITTCDTVTGVQEYNIRNSVTIFPNPAMNQLTVTGNQLSENSTVEIYDVMGGKQIVLHLKAISASIDISCTRNLFCAGANRTGNSREEICEAVSFSFSPSSN